MGNKLCCAPSSSNNVSHDLGVHPLIVITHRIGNCSVALTLNKVINEDVDAIVLQANSKLKMCQRTSQMINKYGGQSIQEELKKILMREGGRLDFGQVVYTHAGDMDFDFLFFAILPSLSDSTALGKLSKNTSTDFHPSDSLIENLKSTQSVYWFYMDQQGNSEQKYKKQHIFECILNILKQASQLGLKSIAMPVIEPPSHSTSKSLIATIMLLAVKTYMKEVVDNTLTRIHITIQDSQTLQLFKWAYTQIIINDDTLSTPCNNIIQSQKQVHYWNGRSLGNSQPNDSILNDINVDEFIRFGHDVLNQSQFEKSKSNDLQYSI